MKSRSIPVTWNRLSCELASDLPIQTELDWVNFAGIKIWVFSRGVESAFKRICLSLSLNKVRSPKNRPSGKICQKNIC